ncbi:hypothetical protein MASR1M66_15650 [Aminivibrio sp.]
MCSKATGSDMVLAWPQAEIAVMGAEGAANIVFRREIEAAEDSTAMRTQKMKASHGLRQPVAAGSVGLSTGSSSPRRRGRALAGPCGVKAACPPSHAKHGVATH